MCLGHPPPPGCRGNARTFEQASGGNPAPATRAPTDQEFILCCNKGTLAPVLITLSLTRHTVSQVLSFLIENDLFSIGCKQIRTQNICMHSCDVNSLKADASRNRFSWDDTLLKLSVICRILNLGIHFLENFRLRAYIKYAKVKHTQC